jgi:hypothetical protein
MINNHFRLKLPMPHERNVLGCAIALLFPQANELNEGRNDEKE